MSTVFKPRRSNKGRMDQTGTTGKYANAVLGAGELFLERQQTGTTYTEGSGTASSPVKYRMKIGDGSTVYSNLGYADNTPVTASGSAGDGNLVGNVAADNSTGGITTTFQSLADKKVSSITSNSSTTVANALNTVAANNTLKDILGALKQAVSLCNTAITSLNDDFILIKKWRISIPNSSTNESSKTLIQENVGDIFNTIINSKRILLFCSTDDPITWHDPQAEFSGGSLFDATAINNNIIYLDKSSMNRWFTVNSTFQPRKYTFKFYYINSYNNSMNAAIQFMQTDSNLNVNLYAWWLTVDITYFYFYIYNK